MSCESCGHDNRADSRFCAGCGASLPRNCESCGRDLAVDARFCDGCGASVAPPDTQAPSADAVRKTVTALFCDLVGSTAFGEKVDAESAREAMGRYHEMAKSVIEANGGTVAKFIGDGVMALFGVPEVAEDDAERAVRTGLVLQEGFVEIGEHIRERYDVDLGLRVGINTGEVVIAEDDNDIVGDALNTAARLEAACAPGKVLVGESTWRLTRSGVDYSDGHEVEAKGKDDPVSAYEVIEALDAEDDLATPFVGRDEELAKLHSVLEDTILQRSARMVTVIGSPGVGKTRLARELKGMVDGGVLIHELRCERAGATTFAPVADLLRAVAGIADSDSVTEIQAALRVAVDRLDDADRVADLLGGFLGVTAMRSTEEMFFAVRRLLEVLGEQEPVMLVVDDIQWAEPLFLDLLEHLAEWVQSVPLLVVALARPEIREARPGFAEVGRSIAVVVGLEGLDEAATGELAARLLGSDRLPPSLLAKIPESTEGNPLFVRELVRMLVDDGVISNESGSWELVIDLEAVEVPPTVITLLASRVERMEPDERRLLELAAVVGPEFAVGALAEIGEQQSRAELDRILERLRRKELVEPTGTYLGDEPIYRFHHVLIRDAAYRRLLKGARVDLHTAVGEWIEDASASLVGEHEVTIANHFEQAHHYRLELDLHDDKTADLGERAARLLHIAANRSVERDDLAAASALATRALRCVPDDFADSADLLLIGCEATLGLGKVAEAQPLVGRLGAVAGDDPRLGAWIHCFEAELVVLTDPAGLQASDLVVDAAAALLEEHGDLAGVAKARLVRAAVLARLGRIGECETQLDLALTAARAVDDGRRVAAVLGAAPVAALWGPSPVPRAGGRCLDVVRLLRITTGSPAVEATSIRCQAVLEALRGRFDTAREMLASARATVEELGLGHGLLEVEFYTGIVELLADDPVDAEPHLRIARDGLGQLGIGAEAGQAAAYLARSLLLQGRLDEAADLVAESDALAGQNPQTAIVARSVNAEVLAARGDINEAIESAEAAVRLAAGSDILIDHANAVASLARVRAAAGDDEGAASAAASANALYEQKGATIVVDVGSTVQADLSVPEVENSSGVQGNEPWNDADRSIRVALDHQSGQRVKEWIAAMAEDVLIDDRRSMLGSVSDGRQEVLDNWAHLGDIYPPMEAVHETVATRGDNVALTRTWMKPVGDEDEFVINLLSIGRVDGDGCLDLRVIFDPERVEEAQLELDSLVTPNMAVRIGSRIDRAMREESPQVDRYVADPQRLFEGKRHPFGAPERRVLAVRSDEFALIEVNLADGSWCFSVEEFDEAGRLIEWTLFGAGDLVGAMDFLDRRSLEFADQDWWPMIVEYSIANRARDAVVMNRLLADDLVIVDRRPLGYGEVDKAAVLKSYEGQPSITTLVTSEVLQTSGRTVLSRVSVQDGPAGARTEGTVALSVVECIDGQITRMELLPVDDYAAAQARFAEFTEGSGEGLADAGAGDAADSIADAWAPSNRASELSESPETLDLSSFAEDVVLDDRRRLVQSRRDGADEVARFTAALVDRYEWVSAEVLAVRGDALVLRRTKLRSHNTEGAIEFDYVDLHRWTSDDHLDLVILWDPGDLADAVAELKRLYLDSLPLEEAPIVALIADTEYAMSHRDVDGVLALFHPDAVISDERPLSFPEMTGEVFRDHLQFLFGSSREFVAIVAMIHESNLQGSAMSRVHRFATTDGSELENRFVMVAVVDPGTGLIVRADQIEWGQHDRAADRLAELISEQPWQPQPNLAVVVGGAINRQVRQESPQLDRFVADPQRLLEAERHPFGVTERNVLAVRSEELALIEVNLTDGSWCYSVEEINARGLLTEWTLFNADDLAGAMDLLETRWLQFADQDWWPMTVEFSIAHRARDVVVMDRILADDFLSIDHRPLGWGEVDKAMLLGIYSAPATDTTLLTSEILATGGAGVVGRISFQAGAAGVRTEGTLALTVTEIRGGQIGRLDMFPVDDLAAAEARFAEFSQGGADDPESRRPDPADNNLADAWAPSNRASELWGTSPAALVPRFAADVVLDDRRRMLQSRLEGHDELARFATALVDRYEWVAAEVLAVRGDDLVLRRTELRSHKTEGAIEYEYVELHRWTSDEYLDLVILWDPADIVDAVAEMERLYLDTLPPVEVPVSSAVVDMESAMSHRDVDGVLALMHPGLVSVDERSLPFPEMDIEQFRDRLEFLFSSCQEFACVVAMIHEVGVHGEVGSVIYRFETDDGSELEQRFVAMFAVDPATGLVTQAVQFEWGAHDSAVDRLAELVDDLPLQPRPNLAVTVGGAINRQMRQELPQLDRFVADPERLLEAERHPFGVVERSVLAVRFEQLALIEVELTDGSWCFSVEEVDERGLLTEWTLFEADDLAGALDLLDTRALEFADQEWWPLIVEFSIASRARDAAGLDRVVAHDFAGIDHRPIGWGEFDKEVMVAVASDPGTETTLVISDYLATTGAGIIGHSSFQAGDAGVRTEGTLSLTVTEVRGGQISRMELFPVEDFAAAHARFDEFSQAVQGIDSHEPWNDADRIADDRETNGDG